MRINYIRSKKFYYNFNAIISLHIDRNFLGRRQKLSHNYLLLNILFVSMGESLFFDYYQRIRVVYSIIIGALKAHYQPFIKVFSMNLGVVGDHYFVPSCPDSK